MPKTCACRQHTPGVGYFPFNVCVMLVQISHFAWTTANRGQSSSTGSCKLTTNAHLLKREIVTQCFTQYFFHRAFIPRYYSGPYLLKKKIQGFPNCSPLSEHTSQGKKNYTRNTETLKKADINISKQSISGGGRDGQTLRLDWEKYSASMSAPFNGANCGCSGAPAAAMELLRVAESRNEMVLALPLTTISFLLRATFWSCNLVWLCSACSPPPTPPCCDARRETELSFTRYLAHWTLYAVCQYSSMTAIRKIHRGRESEVCRWHAV